MSDRGTLKEREPHPSAHDAKAWIASLPADRLIQLQEAYASTSIEGNRLAEVCSETLRRLLDSEPVSDRYLLGLAWSIRNILDVKPAEIRDEDLEWARREMAQWSSENTKDSA